MDLTFELFNKSFNNVFQLRKKQELGYFMILNDGGKEIRFACRKEHYYKIYILLYTILYTIIYYKLYTRLYTIKILVFLISTSFFVKFRLFCLQFVYQLLHFLKV